MTQPTGGLTAAQVAALVALIEAQAAVRAQVTRAAVNAAVAAFTTLTDWWDAGRVSRAIDAALRVVQPSQVQAARVTDAYLARTATVMTGRTVRPVGAVDVTRLRRSIPEQVARDLVAGRRTPAYTLLGEHDPQRRRVVPAETLDAPVTMSVPDPARTAASPALTAAVSDTRPGETVAERIRRRRREQVEAEAAARRAAEGAAREAAEAVAVDPADPYGRVADAYRYQVVAKGSDNERARRYALARVAAVAATDVTLAVREQYRKSLTSIRGVTGWRRILRPELSETGPCGLCVVAADRTYNIRDLKPIHDRCCCEVLPIIGSMDPGLDLNHSDLQRIYDLAGGTGGEVIKEGKRHSAALKKIRVALVEHGELGPVLVDADQRYRGPREVAAMKVPDRAVRARAQLASLEESYARLVRRELEGEDVDQPKRWQERRIAELRRDLVDA